MISSQVQIELFKHFLPKAEGQKKPVVEAVGQKKLVAEAIDQNKEFEKYRGKVQNKIAYAYVAFIDIAGFSSKIKDWGVENVQDYLNQYYNEIFPIIHKHHGQIDKIMGDGIVVVFSNVFGFAYSNGIGSACLDFCKECVETLEKSIFAVKAAIASGQMFFCKTGVEEVYEEISCIGHPMTTAFRLENEASANEIWILRSDSLSEKCQVEGIWFSRYENVYMKGVDESKALVYQCSSLIAGAATWLNR